MDSNEINDAKSDVSREIMHDGSRRGGWIKVGAIAAASALAGGLAAAWYYRQTLKTLREAESSGANPEFGIPDSDTEEEI